MPNLHEQFKAWYKASVKAANQSGKRSKKKTGIIEAVVESYSAESDEESGEKTAAKKRKLPEQKESADILTVSFKMRLPLNSAPVFSFEPSHEPSPLDLALVSSRLLETG